MPPKIQKKPPVARQPNKSNERANKLQEYYRMRFKDFIAEVAQHKFNELNHVNGSHRMFQRTVDGESQFLNLQSTGDGKAKPYQIRSFYKYTNPDYKEINILQDFAELIKDYPEIISFTTFNSETKKQYINVLLNSLNRAKNEPFDPQIITPDILATALIIADQMLSEINEVDQKFLINSLFSLIIESKNYKTINLSLNFRNKLLQLFQTPKDEVALILGAEFVTSSTLPSNYVIEDKNNKKFIISIDQNGEILQISQFEQNKYDKYNKTQFLYNDSDGNIKFTTLSELIKESDRSIDKLRLCGVAANKIKEEIVFGIKVQLGETVSSQQQLVDNKIVTFNTYIMYGDNIENKFIPKANLFSLEYGSKIPLIKPTLVNFSHGKVIGSSDLETVFIESNQGYFATFRFNSSGEKIIIDYFYRKNNPISIPQLPNQEFCKQYPIDEYIRISAIDYANVSEFIEKLGVLKFEMGDFEDHLEKIVKYDKIDHKQKQLIIEPYKDSRKLLNDDLLLTCGIYKIIYDNSISDQYWHIFNDMSELLIKDNHTTLISVDQFLELEKNCNYEPQALYSLYQQYYFSQVGQLKGYLCYKLSIYYEKQYNFDLSHIYRVLGFKLRSGESFYYDAKLWEEFENTEVAKNQYLQALNPNTTYIEIELKSIAANNLANIYYKQDISKAIQYFTVAVELGSKIAYVGLAKSYYKVENYSKAIINLNIASDLINNDEIKPDRLRAEVYYIFGKIRLDSENKYLYISIEKAIDYLEQASKLGKIAANFELVDYYEKNDKSQLASQYIISAYESDSYGSQVKAYAAYRLAKWYSRFEPNEKEKIEAYFMEADDLVEPQSNYYWEIMSGNPHSNKEDQYIKNLELKYHKNNNKAISFELALKCFKHTNPKIQQKSFDYFKSAYTDEDLNTQMYATIYLIMILVHELCDKKFDSRQVQGYINFMQDGIKDILDDNYKLRFQLQLNMLTADYYYRLGQHNQMFQLYSRICQKKEYLVSELLITIVKMRLAKCYEDGCGGVVDLQRAKIIYKELCEDNNYSLAYLYFLKLRGSMTSEEIDSVRQRFREEKLKKITPIRKYFLFFYAKFLIKYEKNENEKSMLLECVNQLTKNQLYQIEYGLGYINYKQNQQVML